MNERRAIWLLWLLLFATVPLPYFAVEVGREPAMKLLAFAVATGAAELTEPSGMAGFVTAMFWVQTLLYGGVLYLVSRRLWPRLARHSRRVLLVALALWLAFLVLVPVYRTPFSPHGANRTLAGLWP